jgi:CBS domain containing-hemolysin-like protein
MAFLGCRKSPSFPLVRYDSTTLQIVAILKLAKALLLLQDPNNFLSTVQVGVTLVGVLSSA